MKQSDFLPLYDEMETPLIMAGPCSAESEAQLLSTAKALKESGVNLFRAGIWKPRTRPNSFEGVGAIGLPWMQTVKAETGLRLTTEVANANHVEQALRHDIDVLWIGARTTVNPFTVQEIADALKGTDTPVIIKNPINPDLNLWIGAIERFQKAGLKRLVALHRGFSHFGNSKYRNIPHWQIALDMMQKFPDMPILCDISHIAGNRTLLPFIAQKALDLNFDGLMIEVHPDPEQALSDSKQQLTPPAFKQLLNNLIFRQHESQDEQYQRMMRNYRQQIDEIDEELIRVLGARMKVAQKIGSFKLDNNISIFQPERWSQVLENAISKGNSHELSETFMAAVLKAIHQESINHQENVMLGNPPSKKS